MAISMMECTACCCNVRMAQGVTVKVLKGVAQFSPLLSSSCSGEQKNGFVYNALHLKTKSSASLNGDAVIASVAESTERSPRKYNKKSDTKKKAVKDSDMPKRPPSAYFIFMETFRKKFKEENPDVKGVTASAKAGGEKWLSMSEEEKAPYVADAAVRKAQYEKSYDRLQEW